jgi:hypothetical protein
MLTRNAWVPELGVVLKKGGLYSLKGLTYWAISNGLTTSAWHDKCTPFPAKVYDNLDALNRNFLWGSTVDKRELHLVNWKKVT